MIRVFLVDDQNTIRQILKSYLEAELDIEVVGSADSGQGAVEQMETLRPDVALVDIEMPGIDGLTTTRLINQRFPECQVLVLSSYDDDEYLNRALQAGAKGYLLKATPAKELADAIRSVHKGYFQLGPGLLKKFLFNFPGSKPKATLDDDVIQKEKVIENKILKLERIGEDFFEQQNGAERIAAGLARISEEQRILKIQLNTLRNRISRLEKSMADWRNVMLAVALLIGAIIIGYLWSR